MATIYDMFVLNYEAIIIMNRQKLLSFPHPVSGTPSYVFRVSFGSSLFIFYVTKKSFDLYFLFRLLLLPLLFLLFSSFFSFSSEREKAEEEAKSSQEKGEGSDVVSCP